jgi:protein TonB
MKKYIFISAIFFFTNLCIAQEGVNVEGNSVSTREIAPVWPGCESSELSSKDCFNKKLNLHLKENFKYPRDTKGGFIRGKSTISFCIDENGKVADVRAVGPEKAVNQEAVRIVKLLPEMKPGTGGGKPKKIEYKMAFNF